MRMAGTQPLPQAASAVRGRKKATLLVRIRQQLEFYFGDANLNKDRFLQEKLKESEDGFVPLSVLLTFNKLRSLTTDESVVQEAIKGSSLLVLSADGSNVKRAMALLESGPVDEKTLYVENLPEHADIDWVRGKFSAFGSVQYVSLPRYKKSLKLKGFAFVEFDGADAVERAIQYFTTGSDTPADMYEKEAALPVMPSVTVLDFEEEDLYSKHGHKRKHEETTAEDAFPPPSNIESPPSSSAGLTKKPPQTDKTDKTVKTTFSPELLPLQVMPKVTWLSLRRKYLDMQKASYRALKQKLKILTVADDKTANEGEDICSDEEDQEMHEVTRSAPLRRAQSPPTIPTVAFLEGVIVHVKLKQPVEDRKKTITATRTVPHVLFVDVCGGCGGEGEGGEGVKGQEGDTLYVRCDSAEVVGDVVVALKGMYEESVVRVLEGQEEKVYWEKIQADMASRAKAAKGKRGKAKVRGGVDIVKQAEKRSDETTVKNTHIKFTD